MIAARRDIIGRGRFQRIEKPFIVTYGSNNIHVLCFVELTGPSRECLAEIWAFAGLGPRCRIRAEPRRGWGAEPERTDCRREPFGLNAVLQAPTCGLPTNGQNRPRRRL